MSLHNHHWRDGGEQTIAYAMFYLSSSRFNSMAAEVKFDDQLQALVCSL